MEKIKIGDRVIIDKEEDSRHGFIGTVVYISKGESIFKIENEYGETHIARSDWLHFAHDTIDEEIEAADIMSLF